MLATTYQRKQINRILEISKTIKDGEVKVSYGGCVCLLIKGGSLCQFGKTRDFRFFYPAYSSNQEKITLRSMDEVVSFLTSRKHDD